MGPGLLSLPKAWQLQVDPEERDDFRHPDLLGYVTANRPTLAVDALTIIRAYFVAGCPQQAGPTFGSYEAWAKVIRGAIVWCGLSDPLLTRETAKAQDDTLDLLRMLVHGLLEADPDRTGMTTKEIERVTSHRPDEIPTCPSLIEAVGMICGDKFNAKSLTNKIRSFQNRTVDGLRIESKSAGKGLKKWVVAKPTNPNQPCENAKNTRENAYSTGEGCLGWLHTSQRIEGRDLMSYVNGVEHNQPMQPNQPSKVSPTTEIFTTSNPSKICCGSEMLATSAGAGWINLECPKCQSLVRGKVECG